jgi:hypothetical protein
MTTPVNTVITLGGFIDFASAGASKRVGAVQDVATMQLAPYDRSHDFYAGVREAISLGIANGDDLVRMRRAVNECTWRRRESYEAVARGWESWRPRKALEVFSQPVRWEEQGLAVRVSPKFRWLQRRQSNLVWPHLKADELTGDAIQAAIRIMEMTFPPSLGRPAVLDVRRGRLYQSRRRSNNFDAWLAGEASAFLAILASITDAE